MTTTARAKFRCTSVKAFSAGPAQTTRWSPDGNQTVDSFPREFEFTAVTDNDTPENIRFAQSTPVGALKMTVDNPAVVFTPGQEYYLDFSPVAAP